MAYEIVYTSSKAGLGTGSKGFCIVGATNGIPPATLKTLESLSGYRHIHPPAGGPHPSNPTVFSHLILPSGESILSRKCDAGLDYSGRSNNLSHHFVLSNTNQLAGGPARVMASPDMMFQQWQGDSRALAPRTVQSASELSGPCNAWQRATGDAGWAGELANTANNSNKNEAYIVFDEGIDCFPLIDEALSLLPPQDRWQVTFSTFLTSLPPNMKCQWRCVMKGSKEHQSMPPHGHILKLDLTKPLGKAPDSALATAARTGNRIAIAVKAPAPAIVPAKPPTPSANRPLPVAKPAVAETAGGDSDVWSSLPVVPLAGHRSMPMGSPERVSTPPYNSKKKILMAAIICGLLGLIFGGAGVFVLGRIGYKALSQVASEPQSANIDEAVAKLEEREKQLEELLVKERTNTESKNELEDQMERLISENNDLKEKLKVKSDEPNKKPKNALVPDTPSVAPKMEANPTPENSIAEQKESGQHELKELPVTIVLEQIASLSKTEFSSIATIQLIGPKGNATELYFNPKEKWYGMEPSDGLVSKPIKLFKLANKDGKSTLREDNDWKPPHSDKLVSVISSSGERFYQIGSSNTIQLPIGKNTASLPIHFLNPTSIEIDDLRQGKVTWKRDLAQPKPMQQVWFVEAQGAKVEGALGNTPPQVNSKKAVLTLDWNNKEGQFVVNLDVSNGVKDSQQAMGLSSIEELTRQVQESPLTFALILKKVTLAWDDKRTVDVKTSVKIAFIGGIPDPTGPPDATRPAPPGPTGADTAAAK